MSPPEPPEVTLYRERQEQLADFVRRKGDLYQELQDLVTACNDARELAEKAVRAQRISSEGFVKLSEAHIIDADKLHEWMGEENFAALGGYIEVRQVRRVNKDVFLRAVAARLVPAEVVDEVFRVEVRYSTPKRYVLP